MTDPATGPTIPVKIDRIYEYVQELRTDVAVLKSNSLEKRVEAQQVVIEEHEDKISTLRAQLTGITVVFGIVVTIISTLTVNGLNL